MLQKIEIINPLEIFNRIFNDFKNRFECDYLFYHFQYKAFKLSLSTNTDWMNIYIDEKLIESCPLVRVGLDKIASSSAQNVILRWDDVQASNKNEKNTVGIRNEFNICNGISFGRKVNGISEYFGMATDCKNYTFTRDIIFNSNIIRNSRDELFYSSFKQMFLFAVQNSYLYFFNLNIPSF